MKERIGFLGPSGTLTEEALRKSLSLNEKTLIPYNSIQEVIAAVERKETDKGFVAIENSIEGSVNPTLDMLAFETNLLIEQEFIYSISHNLLVPPGVKKAEIKAIISHPQASAQCRLFLMREFPGVPILAANSTSEAAKIAAEDPSKKMAVVGTALAAKLYGLKVAAKNIQDFADNQTRFVMLGNKIAPRTGYDKTSIVCFIYEDRPGSLLQILQEFAYRYINLTKIQSRPTRKALGEYCFFVDLEGHIEDTAVAEALNCLKCKLRKVKILGSYPRAKLKKK